MVIFIYYIKHEEKIAEIHLAINIIFAFQVYASKSLDLFGGFVWAFDEIVNTLYWINHRLKYAQIIQIALVPIHWNSRKSIKIHGFTILTSSNTKGMLSILIPMYWTMQNAKCTFNSIRSCASNWFCCCF